MWLVDYRRNDWRQGGLKRPDQSSRHFPFYQVPPRDHEPHELSFSTALRPRVKALLDQAFAEGMPLHFSLDDVPSMRAGASSVVSADPVLDLSSGGTHEERTIPGPNGDILVSILRPATFDPAKQHPAILFYHPGGMIMGNRFTGLEVLVPYLDSFNAIIISPEYRLAPEHPSPIPFEEAYATLKWTGDNLKDLCIDPARLMLAGTSGGGAICAGVTLLARERGGPKVCGQLLVAPMLDDRNESVSACQFDEGGRWSTRSNRFAWSCVLGQGVERTMSKTSRRPVEPQIYRVCHRRTSKWGRPRCVETKWLRTRASCGRAGCKQSSTFGPVDTTTSLLMPSCRRKLCVPDASGSSPC